MINETSGKDEKGVSRSSKPSLSAVASIKGKGGGVKFPLPAEREGKKQPSSFSRDECFGGGKTEKRVFFSCLFLRLFVGIND